MLRAPSGARIVLTPFTSPRGETCRSVFSFQFFAARVWVLQEKLFGLVSTLLK